MNAALYKSKSWLQMQRSKGLTAAEIGKLCGVSEVTIVRYLDKFGMNPGKRNLK